MDDFTRYDQTIEQAASMMEKSRRGISGQMMTPYDDILFWVMKVVEKNKDMRIEELEAENARLREVGMDDHTRAAFYGERIDRLETELRWIATMDVEDWPIDTVQDVVERAKEALGE